MIKRILLFAIVCLIIKSVYAIETANVIQGAEQYDWQHCFDSKSGDCLNGCTDSENINCSDNCKSEAKDKCLSLGLSPP